MTGSRRTAKKATSMENSPNKKAKFAAEATPSNITVTVDPTLLECCGCSKPLVPPLFQCTSGHITCSDCCTNLDHWCSFCADPEPTTRCLAMECVLSSLTVPCSFKEHGCSEMTLYTEKLTHEESCPHAPCYCPFTGCGPYSGLSLLDHINQAHLEILRTSVTGASLSPLSMHDGEVGRLLYLGSRAVFLFLVDDWSVPSGRSLSVVRLMTGPLEEEDFKYKIQVYARTAMLVLSSVTESVGRLTKAYQVGASLFIPNTMWSSPGDCLVYVALE